MHCRHLLLWVFTIFCAGAFQGGAFAQGVTTANITGVIEDTNGEVLPGATVQATHTPSGTQYGAAASADGRFTISNVRVGGPYTITASYVGYQSKTEEGVNLGLGQNYTITFTLAEGDVQLEDVIVRAKQDNVLNSDRTGADTKISSQEIQSLPTVQRDLSDFTRLTPQANLTGGGGISIAGINNRYNAIYIDGAVNNDVFGLTASGTNGGQAGVSPISLDAIDELQVVVAPYDVRQGGFAGGGINAVTRSGTNTFEGSAYWLSRNQNLAGKTPTNNPEIERTKLAEFSSKVYGVRLGGPIIQDKLFFFVNAELERRETPAPFNFADYNAPEGLTQADVDNFANTLRNEYGYEPGGYLGVSDELRSDKLFARLDWNINERHKLTLRHSYTFGASTTPANTNINAINFANSGVYFPSTTNSSALELNSRFSNAFSNNLIIGYTTVNDDRDPLGQDFPGITIRTGNIYAGSELYSTGNQLTQDVLTITDNFNWYKGAHTITLGTHNEFYGIYNLFVRRAYGEYTYPDLASFFNGDAPTEYRRQYSLVDDISGDGSAAAAKFNAFQLGLYLQDEWYPNNQLKLTGGLRVDIPVFSDEPVADANFNNNILPELGTYYNTRGAMAGQLPKTSLLFSPRFGFNYDLKGDRSTQLRGGIGIFTSRLPFVWLGGPFTNSGVVLSEVRERPRDDEGNPLPITLPNGQPLAFRPDVNNQYTNADFGRKDEAGGQIDLFSRNFKLPQVMRVSLAVDQQLPAGIVGTLEGMYTKTMNNVTYQNINITPPVTTMNGPDNRPIYGDTITGNYSDVLLAYNTNQGYSWNITAQLQKPFASGLFASLAYTFGQSKAINDGTSSQNSSQWRYMENVNGRNNLDLSYSDFDLGSRIVGAISYDIEYAEHLRTQVSLFYNGQSGQRFSYVYSKNVNNEDLGGNSASDLIYVPENFQGSYLVDRVDNDGQVLETAEQQWEALDTYIANNKYLSKRRGQYAERNGSRTPFQNILDLRVLQDFYVRIGEKTNTLQFSLDVFNFTNLLNKNWGRRYFVSNDNYLLLQVVKGGENPAYNFTAPSNEVWQINDAGISSSRWQAQVGVRYIFGN